MHRFLFNNCINLLIENIDLDNKMPKYNKR